MRQSQLFTKTERNAPKDETTVNAQLLARAGFVSKLMAGTYSYLPLGLRVLRNIENVVREEMDAIGGEEILMPMLHPKSIWTATGGWEKIDVLFKLKSRTEKEKLEILTEAADIAKGGDFDALVAKLKK